MDWAYIQIGCTEVTSYGGSWTRAVPDSLSLARSSSPYLLFLHHLLLPKLSESGTWGRNHRSLALSFWFFWRHQKRAGSRPSSLPLPSSGTAVVRGGRSDFLLGGGQCGGPRCLEEMARPSVRSSRVFSGRRSPSPVPLVLGLLLMMSIVLLVLLALGILSLPVSAGSSKLNPVVVRGLEDASDETKMGATERYLSYPLCRDRIWGELPARGSVGRRLWNCLCISFSVRSFGREGSSGQKYYPGNQERFSIIISWYGIFPPLLYVCSSFFISTAWSMT